MRLKTYFVDCVEDAMQQARSEFGPEAMLVHSKRTSTETAHLGAYEVVFAASTSKASSPIPAPPPLENPVAWPRTGASDPLVRLPGAGDGAGHTLEETREVKAAASTFLVRELRQLARMMTGAPKRELAVSEEIRSSLDELYSYMAEREIEAALAWDVVESIGREMMRRRMRGLECVPQDLLRERLTAKLNHNGSPVSGSLRVIVLLGPTGAGKTATLAKLAVREGLAKGLDTHVLDLDSARIGGGEHLRSIASLLELRYQRLAKSELLPGMLDRIRTPALVLVDTPGFSQKDRQEINRMAAVISSYPSMERHLVLPAALRYADLAQRFRNFADCRPTHLLYTQIDETSLFGPLWSLAAHSGLSVSWVGTGPGIPEGLADANPDLLVSLVCNGRLGTSLNPTVRPLRSAAKVGGVMHARPTGQPVSCS